MVAYHFEAELVRLIPKMRAYAVMLARSREAGHDLVQDALVRVLRFSSGFAPGTNLEGWVFTILRHEFISGRRKKAMVVVPLDVDGWDPGGRGAQEDTVMLGELMRAMGGLPAAQREALILVGAVGSSYADVSVIAGCSVGTVKSRVSRARDFLRAHFDEADGDALPLSASTSASPALDRTVPLRLEGSSIPPKCPLRHRGTGQRVSSMNREAAAPRREGVALRPFPRSVGQSCSPIGVGH